MYSTGVINYTADFEHSGEKIWKFFLKSRTKDLSLQTPYTQEVFKGRSLNMDQLKVYKRRAEGDESPGIEVNGVTWCEVYRDEDGDLDWWVLFMNNEFIVDRNGERRLVTSTSL